MTTNASPASSGRQRRDLAVQYLLADITLLSAEELALAQGFAGVNDSFRAYLTNVGISPVPHRRGYFDPQYVRARLNSVQGLFDAGVAAVETQPVSLVEQRRARRGQK